MAEILFYAMAVVALGSAVAMVTRKSPVASLLYMVTTLASLAVIFVLFEAHFLAAIQVIVYAGAIMVLFLFVIMLLNLGHDYRKDLRGGIAAILSLATSGALAGLLVRHFRASAPDPLAGRIGDSGLLESLLAERGAVGAMARPLYVDYVVAFEVTGLLLLVAVVGALALAKRRV